MSNDAIIKRQDGSLLETPILLVDSSGNMRYARIDGATNSLHSLTFDHHKIHAGDHYNISGTADLPLDNVFDLQFTTPNTTKWGHLIFELSVEKETNWYIYEGASVSTAGTAVTVFNNDRNSANTSGMVVKSITNASVADANADTPVAGATLIMQGILGDRLSGGFIGRGRELILKQNTIYCMRAVATVAGYISYIAEWYEQTNVN